MAGTALAVMKPKADPDAVEIGKLWRKACSSLVESSKYYLECGRKLAEKKATLKHGEWLPWLADNTDVLGFDTPQTGGKLMKAAKLNAGVQIESESDAVEVSRTMWGHTTTRGTTGTGENEWYTPVEYVDLARTVMGVIDLDPASSDQAQSTVQALQHFTQADDGLKRVWHGNVWLNRWPA